MVLHSPQHGTDADENQVTDCQKDGQLDDQDGDAEEDSEDTQSYARGCQNEGNAHSKYKDSQKDNSDYSQYVGCFSHCFFPQFFPLLALNYAGYLRSAVYTKIARAAFPVS